MSRAVRRSAGSAPLPRRSPGPLLRLLLLLLLACCAGAGQGAPLLSQEPYPEQELQLWNEVDAACSPFLSVNSQAQVPDALKELCFMFMAIPPRPQEQDEKDNTKRFLFHYSKTQNLGNSNVVPSVVHPLLQLLPHLHERRMKRFSVHEELQSPVMTRSRGFFLFRPRNGRRSTGLV